jgi:hypothetical protein
MTRKIILTKDVMATIPGMIAAGPRLGSRAAAPPRAA